MANPLQRLARLGQRVWLDDIRQSYFTEGTLSRLIARDGVTGVTSNPVILERAMADPAGVDPRIEVLLRTGASAAQVYDSLMREDIRCAADVLRPVYERTNADDGYVSLEVSPHLAYEAGATVEDARRLWSLVDRPNLMIKVPATEAGITATRVLVSTGINVNVTLLFDAARYRSAMHAYWHGLEDLASGGGAIDRVRSVASFFVSRIDTFVDRWLDRDWSPKARLLRGRTATACAQLAYCTFHSSLGDPRWRTLARLGARPQSLLWASTGTKDPAYSDVKYVDGLVAPGTITTLPPATLAAYRDHGEPAIRLGWNRAGARNVLNGLRSLGLDPDAIGVTLEREGVEKFVTAHDAVLGRFAAGRRSGLSDLGYAAR